MKKIGVLILAIILLGIYIPVSNASAEDINFCDQYKNVSKIWWDGIELKSGQIGRLTIEKDTTLYKLNGDQKVVSRTLKAGEFYRIYAFKPGMLSVGGGYYVDRDEKVTYQTPSKTKLKAVQCINRPVGKYYGHTYGTKNAYEYNRVMEIATKAMEGYKDLAPFKNEYHMKYYERYMNGERAENFDKDSLDYRGLTLVDKTIGDMLDAGVTKYQIEDALKAQIKAFSKIREVSEGTVGGKSAYDSLVRKILDCDSSSHALASMFETVGYRTKIIATSNHAKLLIQIGEEWFDTTGGYTSIDLSNLGTYRIYVY